MVDLNSFIKVKNKGNFMLNRSWSNARIIKEEDDRLRGIIEL